MELEKVPAFGFVRAGHGTDRMPAWRNVEEAAGHGNGLAGLIEGRTDTRSLSLGPVQVKNCIQAGLQSLLSLLCCLEAT
jgi:hypothetical protein